MKSVKTHFQMMVRSTDIALVIPRHQLQCPKSHQRNHGLWWRLYPVQLYLGLINALNCERTTELIHSHAQVLLHLCTLMLDREIRTLNFAVCH